MGWGTFKPLLTEVTVSSLRPIQKRYQELLELGVVNSNVQLKQVMDLLEDAKFGEVLNKVNGV